MSAAGRGGEPDGQRAYFDDHQNDSVARVAAPTSSGFRRRVGVAIGLVTLGVLLLVFGIVTLTTTDDPQSTTSQDNAGIPLTSSATVSPPAPAPDPGTSAGPTSPVVLPVTVLNNSSLIGLASKVAAELEAGGWPIAELLNYSETQVPATTVFFTPGNAAEQAAAQALVSQFPEITGGAEPRFEGLDGAGLTVAAVGDWQP